MPSVKLEIRHLKLLAAVAEEGGVTAAGRRLHLTQSALSHQLRDAEQRVGASLFLRLNKKMIPTPAGEQLLLCARRILDDLAATEEKIQRAHNGGGGLIRVATECYTCYHWLPSVLKAFHAKFPKVDVRIEAEATSAPLAALLQGKLDIGIVSGRVGDPNLRMQPLFEDEMAVVMSARHPLASRRFVRPADLAGETVVIYPPKEESTLLIKFLQPAGVVPGKIEEVPLTEAQIEIIAAEMGIGFLPRWTVAPQVQLGRLAIRPMGSRGYRRRWLAVTVRHNSPPPHLDEFISLLQKYRPSATSRIIPSSFFWDGEKPEAEQASSYNEMP
jgi:LysR family transcriptional regulator, regulator for metE and metH